MLLTGLACSSPLHTYAAEWLSSSKSDAATAATAAAPITTLAPATTPSATTPPVPPSPPAATPSTPSAAKPAVQDQAKTKEKPQGTTGDNTVAKSVTSTVSSTWQSLTSWMTPPTSTSKTPPQAKAAGGSTAPANTIVVSPASPARARPNSSRPTTSVGRFDPEFGPAGYSVSDADEQTAQAEAMPRLSPPQQFMPPQPAPEKEQSAVASDEPVSLVSWLSSYATGGHGGNADVYPDVCLTDTCCPKWEAQVDALFLWQGNIPSRPLYVDSLTNATVLDANQLYSPAAIAPRYSLTYHRDDCRAIEVNYFQVWGFNAQQVVGPQTDATGTGAFASNNLVGPDYNEVSGAMATSSANIQSLEVNLRRTDGGMIEWISGFRWLEWGQNLSFVDSITQADTLAGGDFASINTLNNLYGWQLGGDMMLWNAGRWLRVNGIAKAGVYYNHQAAQNTYYTDFFTEANAASSNDTVSFVGETGINASLALTNWLSWRAGYTCFWLGGVATPARQLGLTNIDTNTTSVNTNGSVFLHGVNTGLEARW